MKNHKKAVFVTIVMFLSLGTFAQIVPGIISGGDTVQVEIQRSPQRTIIRTVSVNQTDSLTSKAVEKLSNQVRELNQDATQSHISEILKSAHAERWRFWEILGIIAITLLGLWFVLSNLDPQRFQVMVSQPVPATLSTPTPQSPTEIREIVLGILGEDGIHNSVYAAPRGIAVKSAGNVTIIAYGSRQNTSSFHDDTSSNFHTENEPSSGAKVVMNLNPSNDTDPRG